MRVNSPRDQSLPLDDASDVQARRVVTEAHVHPCSISTELIMQIESKAHIACRIFSSRLQASKESRPEVTYAELRAAVHNANIRLTSSIRLWFCESRADRHYLRLRLVCTRDTTEPPRMKPIFKPIELYHEGCLQPRTIVKPEGASSRQLLQTHQRQRRSRTKRRSSGGQRRLSHSTYGRMG